MEKKISENIYIYIFCNKIKIVEPKSKMENINVYIDYNYKELII